MKERWFCVEDIAAHLGVNRDTIDKWIERKRMSAYKLGRLWKFLASEMDPWIKAGNVAVCKPSARKRKPTKPEPSTRPATLYEIQ